MLTLSGVTKSPPAELGRAEVGEMAPRAPFVRIVHTHGLSPPLFTPSRALRSPRASCYVAMTGLVTGTAAAHGSLVVGGNFAHPNWISLG